MPEPLVLRDSHAFSSLALVRLGSVTLSDEKLDEQCSRSFARWGLHGFSVLEVPGGDWQLLIRLRPVVATRRLAFTVEAGALHDAGFPLLATEDHPHWTVVLSEPSPKQFARLRSLFRGPQQNPLWAARR